MTTPETERLGRSRRLTPPDGIEITEHKTPRHHLRVDVLDRDYRYLKQLSEREGWSMNYLLRRIANRFVTLHKAGGDIGVLVSPLDEG